MPKTKTNKTTTTETEKTKYVECVLSYPRSGEFTVLVPVKHLQSGSDVDAAGVASAVRAAIDAKLKVKVTNARAVIKALRA